MNSLFFIARNNIKKHKGEVAIIFALIFIAAALLFTSLSLMLSGSNMIRECDKNYHVADLLLMAETTDVGCVLMNFHANESLPRHSPMFNSSS